MKKQVYHILTLLYFTVVIFAAERQSISFFWIASNRLHIAMPFLFSVLFVFVLHAVFIAKKPVRYGCFFAYIALSALLVVLSDFTYYWMLISTCTTVFSYFTIHLHSTFKQNKKTKKQNKTENIAVYKCLLFFTYLLLISGYADIAVHIKNINFTAVSVRGIVLFLIISFLFVLFLIYVSPEAPKEGLKRKNKPDLFPTYTAAAEQHLFTVLFLAFIQNFLYALPHNTYYIFFYQWLVLSVMFMQNDTVLLFLNTLKPKVYAFLKKQELKS